MTAHRIIPVYEVYHVDTDGRRTMQNSRIGIYSEEGTAKAKSGSFTGMDKRKAIVVHGPGGTTSTYLLAEDTPIDVDGVQTAAEDEIAKTAMEKLSDEEVRVLVKRGKLKP